MSCSIWLSHDHVWTLLTYITGYLQRQSIRDGLHVTDDGSHAILFFIVGNQPQNLHQISSTRRQKGLTGYIFKYIDTDPFASKLTI